jgi:Fe-S-cluster containining protein
MKVSEIENLEVCKKCGGQCCKNMGCHFSPDDFSDVSYKGLKKEILKGHISIDWWEGDVDTKRNRLGRTFYLRMRNKNAGIIDPAFGNMQCSVLDENTGCPYPFDKRPKGARALIPGYPGRCDSIYTKEMSAMDWRQHYSKLKRLERFFNKPKKQRGGNYGAV